jgi:hypothetical protein
MSNIFTLSGDQIASVAATIVGKDLNLAGLVYRDLAKDFRGGTGSTVEVPVPGATQSFSKAAGDTTTVMSTGTIAEQTISVPLKDHVYSRIALSEEEASLDLIDFSRQVLAPQAAALAVKAEALVAGVLNAETASTTITYSASDPAKAITAARRTLRANGVKESSRIIAVAGSDIYADFLDADTSADPLIVGGKVKGVELHESTRVGASDLFVFVPEAIALVVRAPHTPNGAKAASSVSTKADDGTSFALRWVGDYDTSLAADVSLVSAFMAAQDMPLAVVDEATGTVDLVEHGGIVRVTAAA